MNIAPFAQSAHQSGERSAANSPTGLEGTPTTAAAPARTGNGASEAELSVVVVLGYN